MHGPKETQYGLKPHHDVGSMRVLLRLVTHTPLSSPERCLGGSDGGFLAEGGTNYDRVLQMSVAPLPGLVW